MINGRYHLHNKIGQGGMGIVHRATDRLTGEIVALKQVFLPVEQIMFASRPISQSNRELRLALAHEFQVLAGLRHPNIISVLDYGFDEEQQPFFTMSYLENAQAIVAAANGRSLPQKITLLLHTLEALAYLHRRGILHRDLKPDNVLVVGDTVRVLDFGLAAAKEQATGSVGSWLYIAPELLLGQPASETSDLYSLGVLAYQLFAGTHPFNIYAEDTIGEILEGEPDWSKVAGGEALTAVVQKLLSKQPEQRYQKAFDVLQDLATVAGQSPPIGQAAIRESYLQAAKFVGREAEMAQLTTALRQAASGTGSTWLIGGESGVGKSRLLNELRTIALVNGFQVIRGQAAKDGSIPYQIWREPVRRLVLTTAVNDAEASILKDFVPDIHHLLAHPVADAPLLTGPAYHERLIFTILDLFRRQQTPMLFLAEDLHWTQESLNWLKFLSQFAKGLSLLIVGTYRDDERPELPKSIPQAQLLKLLRLSEADIASLTEAMLGSAGKEPGLLKLLQQETEGNAFFMVEVMRALATEAGDLRQVGHMTLPKTVLTGGVQEVLQRRIGRMPAWGRPLLELAAIIGRQFDLRVLAALAPQTDLSSWLTTGAEIALFEVHENKWRFSHDKLREAVLAGLPQADKKMLHHQVAETIEQTYPEDSTRSEQLMEHWRGAGEITRELPYILKVAHQVPHSRRGFQYALELIARGLTLAEQLQDVSTQLALFIEQGSTYHELGEYTTAQHCLEQALPQIQTLGLSKLQQQAHSGLARVAWQLGRQQVMLEHANQAFALSRAMEDMSGLVRSLNQLGLAFDALGDVAKARSYYHQCLTISRQIGDDSFTSIALNNLGEGYTDEGDYVGAYQYYIDSYQIDRRNGDRRGVVIQLANLGANALARGAWDEARTYVEESIQIQRDMDLGTWLGLALNSMTVVELVAGDYEAAERCIMENLALADVLGNRLYKPEALLWLGYLRLAQNNQADALAACNQAVETARDTEVIVLVDALAGRAFAQTDPAAAWQDLLEALTLVQQNNLGRLRINTLTSVANLYARQGDLERAAALCGLLDAQGSFDDQAMRTLYREPLKAELRTKLGVSVYEEVSQRLLGQPLQDVAQDLLDSLQGSKV